MLMPHNIKTLHLFIPCQLVTKRLYPLQWIDKVMFTCVCLVSFKSIRASEWDYCLPTIAWPTILVYMCRCKVTFDHLKFGNNIILFNSSILSDVCQGHVSHLYFLDTHTNQYLEYNISCLSYRHADLNISLQYIIPFVCVDCPLFW